VAIEQIDRTVIDGDLIFGASPRRALVDPTRIGGVGITVASIRTAVMVFLAGAAILVLLPAVIAAQVAVAI
jgi:hypothetical protein